MPADRHDALTGLVTRAQIVEQTGRLLARTRGGRPAASVVVVDLDDFATVNAVLGPSTGDGVLQTVAERLTDASGDVEAIGRIGGDQFVLLIGAAPVGATTSRIDPTLVAERILDAIRQPFDLAATGSPLLLTASVGIASGDRATSSDLLRDADIAMHHAKASGKDRCVVFASEMRDQIVRRTALEVDLRSAIELGQLRLAYQPIYQLADLTLVGVEALLRWDHPLLGFIEPDEFIPLLEQTGQISDVGQWVLVEACGQMAAWHACGDVLDMSVNVSARQLDRDDIVEHVREALSLTGLSPTTLIIEVTETALMLNPQAAAERLHAIKALGVRIAVDDFGTGYSSLAYLRQFPVDTLKIDRSFTNAMTTSPASRALIRSLAQLGRDLGMTTLAEGVETTDEMDLLRDEQVAEAQGFLLSRPLDPLTLETQILVPSRMTSSSSERT